MPTFYNYALNDMEESQINDAKRRVTGYNNNQIERLSSKPEEDPTNGLIDLQLSRLTDEVYLAGKEIDNLDSYLQIDTSLIAMNAGVPSAIKKSIQDGVRIYISINRSVEKIKRTYNTLSKNIKFASLHIWTDFTAAMISLFEKNLELNNIVDKFVNDYRAAAGQPPVEVPRPEKIDEDAGDGGAGDDRGDDDDGGEGGDEVQPPPPPPPEEDDPTDPESEASFDARTQVDEDEVQDILGVDTALPPAPDLPQTPRVSLSRPTLSRPRPYVVPPLDLEDKDVVSMLADKYKFNPEAGQRLVQRDYSRKEDTDLEESERSGPSTSRPPSSRSSYTTPRRSDQPNLTPDQIKQRIKDLTEKEEKIFFQFSDMFSEEDGTTLLGGESKKLANLLEKQHNAITDEIERLKSFLIPEELPPAPPLPPPNRKPVQLLTPIQLRTDTSQGQKPSPFVRGIEEEDVDHADTWPDLVESSPKELVWPTIASLGEDALIMDDIEDMPYWPDIADQEGFRQRFLANKQDRLLGKMVKSVSSAYAAAWKTLAGSRSPRSFAQTLGKAKNNAKRNILKI